MTEGLRPAPASLEDWLASWLYMNTPTNKAASKVAATEIIGHLVKREIIPSGARMRAGLALLTWYETTHGNTIGEHDHHCLADAKEPGPCTCGWAEAEAALAEVDG